MVNLTAICMKYMPIYMRRPEIRTAYFRRQAIFRLTGTFYGLSRNTWRNAIRKWRKKIEYRMQFRPRHNALVYDLHSQRLLAACEEHGFKPEWFLSSLVKCNLELNIKTLSHLAIYEPRTFEALIDLAKAAFHEQDHTEAGRNMKPPANVITRGMLGD